jgi:hypothetical protein
VIATAVLAAFAATPAAACTLPAGFDQDREVSNDMGEVTSIYRARIDSVVPGPWEWSWDFTLRTTDRIWGARPPDEQTLRRENGACSNWYFIMDQLEDEPLEGTEVVVFATPDGIADSLRLYIVEARSPSATYLFERFGETDAGRQFQATQ